MPINLSSYLAIKAEAGTHGALLVAVSKTKPIEDIQALYNQGHRDFGENYVQELLDKSAALPPDIRWHFIGHLQRNKVKYIAPFVYLVHGVDSMRLLEEIGKHADKLGRTIGCLLQIHIAAEETKFGWDAHELDACWNEIREVRQEGKLKNLQIRGLMGMASFTEDQNQLKTELGQLQALFQKYKSYFDQQAGPPILSMGMSADYRLALELGSNLIRIGSSLFGARG